VFCTPEAHDVLGGRWTMVPVGLALQVRTDTAYVADIAPAWRFEPWPGHMDGYVASIHWLYGSALVGRASYEGAHGRASLARRYLQLAQRFDPQVRPASVPPLPLDGNALVAQAADFFARLEQAVRASSPLRGARRW
jgi:hypothetical protein